MASSLSSLGKVSVAPLALGQLGPLSPCCRGSNVQRDTSSKEAQAQHPQLRPRNLWLRIGVTNQVRGMLRKAGHCPVPVDAEIKNVSSFIVLSTWTCRV